jgi:transketolase
VHTVKPIDEELVRQLASETSTLLTVEEHSRIGGLGSAVAEVMAEIPQSRCRLHRISLPGEFFLEAGSQEYLRAPFISVEALVSRVKEVMAVTT